MRVSKQFVGRRRAAFANQWMLGAAVAVGVIAGGAPKGLATSYTFIPSAGSTPNPGGEANWTDASSWATGSGTGTVPGSADQAGSATGATTVVNSVVPIINELRFANAVSGTTVATPGGTAVASTAEATLRIDAGGALTIQSLNGTSNGDAWFGRAQPSGGHLIIDGGSLTTGSAAAITNDSAANVNIGDIAGSNGAAVGAANSTFAIAAGSLNSGNNLIVGNSFANVSGTNYYATGTVTQTGGAVTAAGAVQVGANGNGTYTISAGTLAQSGTNPDGSPLGRDAFFVGRNANGTSPGATGSFTQSGSAVVTIANGLYIANNSNTHGTYTVAGGSLAIAGEIKVGASTNSTGTTAASGNVGAFNIVGDAAPTITANGLTADTANSTLSFTVQGAAGTTLIDLVPGTVINPTGNVSYDGVAHLSTATNVDLFAGAGFTPAPGEAFELLRAAGISALPTLVTDVVFSGTSLSIVTNPDNTESLVATVSAVPEPESGLALGALSLLLGRRRRR